MQSVVEYQRHAPFSEGLDSLQDVEHVAHQAGRASTPLLCHRRGVLDEGGKPGRSSTCAGHDVDVFVTSRSRSRPSFCWSSVCGHRGDAGVT